MTALSLDGARTLVLTMSFRGDFELCRLACESFDIHADPAVSHLLVVPSADLGLFSELRSSRREVVAEEGLLPNWLWKLPMPPQPWRRRLRLPRRDVYLSPKSPPVRGWIAQQIMKIGAATQAGAEIVVHVDSDTAFIRAFRPDDVIRDGRARLYRDPRHVELDSHRTWHRAAGRLLGLPESDLHGGEYIDSFVVWRRSVAQALVARIEQTTGRDWATALARTPHFSEYILYGAFASEGIGLDAAGLYADPRSYCHSLWTGEMDGPEAEAAFVAGVRPEHLTCLVQSTIPLPLETRRRVLAAATKAAADQDRAGAGSPSR